MRHRHSLVALMLLVAPIDLYPTPAAASEEPGDPLSVLQGALREAERSLDLGEIEQAESLYRSALLEGWLLLGALQTGDGRLPEARAAYEEASRATVETRRALTALALTQLRLGEAAEAATTLRGIINENPLDRLARRLLAQALAASGDLDGAVQELEELHAEAPEDGEMVYALATAYLQQGKPGKAEALFAVLTAARPFAETQVLVGRTYRDHGELDRARATLESALAMDPEIERAHFYLGTVDLIEEGLGRLEEAAEHFRRELLVAPEDPAANLYLGIALAESRRCAEALSHLEAASHDDTSRRDALQFLGRCQLVLDRPDDAVDSLRGALDLAKADPMESPAGGMTDFAEDQLARLHYQLAQALRLLGDEDEAAVHFAAAKESSVRQAESSRDLLARYLENEAARASAEPPMTEAPGIDGLDEETQRALRQSVTRAVAQTYLNLGVLKIQSRRFARAAELFRQAAELDPELPRVDASLGVAYFNAERFVEATGPLTRAVAAAPDDASLRRMLALACLNAERYERAAALLSDDPELATSPPLQYAYGLSLVRSGRPAEAQAIFDGLLELNADWPELNVVLGQAYAQQGNYEAAAETLTRALELDPDVAEAHATLGEMHLRQGRLGEAEEALRAELESHPFDARSRYTLATVLDLAGKPDEALEHLRSILAADPRLANARYLTGKILLAAGAAQDALEQLTAAAALAPEDANIRYQLAQALRALGREDESSREFERFRALKAAQGSGDGS